MFFLLRKKLNIQIRDNHKLYKLSLDIDQADLIKFMLLVELLWICFYALNLIGMALPGCSCT